MMEERILSPVHTAARQMRGELADAISGLSDAEWGRLRKVAAAYARGRPIEADDLLQEAFRRALDGARHCPAHVTVVKFLAEAMRSIAHAEKEKGDNQPVLVEIARHGDSEAVDPPDSRLDPEQLSMSSEATGIVKAAMLALFDDDPIAQIILEGMMEEMEGEELRELTELDATAYQSKRKLIRRRIDKAFPVGWTL
jgi:DNA-directed RNA polymerase specialized sigma24 family protein